jgi:hypothetical protein
MIDKLTTNLNNVQALDDEPNDVTGLLPEQVKAVFDKAPNDIKTYINGLVDILNSVTLGSSGSENISSAPIAGITGNTVYAQISQLLSVAQQAQAGTMLPGIITDVMLSNDPGMAKSQLTDIMTQVADLAIQTAYVKRKAVASKIYAYKNMGGTI